LKTQAIQKKEKERQEKVGAHEKLRNVLV